jgi:hypothetical protein
MHYQNFPPNTYLNPRPHPFSWADASLVAGLDAYCRMQAVKYTRINLNQIHAKSQQDILSRQKRAILVRKL